MRKRIDKRGIETATLVIWVAVALIAAAILLLFYSNAFGMIKEPLKKLSEADIILFSERCEILLSATTTSGFCTDRIPISSGNYVNCPYAIDNFGVNVSKTVPTCDNKEAIKAICNKLRLEQGSNFNSAKVKVNGEACPAA